MVLGFLEFIALMMLAVFGLALAFSDMGGGDDYYD